MSIQHTRLLSLLLLSLSTGAQSAGNTATPPPWLVQSQNFLIMAFNIKVDEVKKLLPAGVEAAVDKEGMVNTVFEMYEAYRVTGIPAYSATFVTVDIKGHDSREGGPAHFPLWGRISPQESANAFVSHFGFPYEYAPISLAMEQGTHAGAVGAAGKEILRVKMQPIADQPFANQGIVNFVGWNAAHELIETEIPYITKGHSARLVSFEVGADHPALNNDKVRDPAVGGGIKRAGICLFAGDAAGLMRGTSSSFPPSYGRGKCEAQGDVI